MHHGHLWMESPASPPAKQTVVVRVRQRGGRGAGVHPSAGERNLCHSPLQPHEVFYISDRFRPVLHRNPTYGLSYLILSSCTVQLEQLVCSLITPLIQNKLQLFRLLFKNADIFLFSVSQICCLHFLKFKRFPGLKCLGYGIPCFCVWHFF